LTSPSTNDHVGIVGAGIIGLATAWTLLKRFPGLEVTVLEKEAHVGSHQTGRNSGVVHTGIYYAPGSLKARLCTTGRMMLQEFCAEKRLPYKELGKLLVSFDPSEEPRLRAIYDKGIANGVHGLRMLPPEGLKEVEPNVSGHLGLHVPTAAITDFGAVARALADEVASLGGRIRTSTSVLDMSPSGDGVEVSTESETIRFTRLVVCAGLQSDLVAEMAGDEPDPRIIPFRGDFVALKPEAASLVKSLIYPVPDPRYPFLGIHLTRMVDDRVLAGPSAVLAFAREGYSVTTVDRRELKATLAWPGFRKLARAHWRTGAQELYRAVSTRAFVRQARRFVKDLSVDDFARTRTSGIRAQAVDRTGALVDDFRVTRSGPVINIRNAPSPAATSSLAIAELIVKKMVSDDLVTTSDPAAIR
jgi:(S)-2-hydroxyglutarate dehydrogenase